MQKKPSTASQKGNYVTERNVQSWRGKKNTVTKKSKFSLKRILLVQAGYFNLKYQKVLESVPEKL